MESKSVTKSSSVWVGIVQFLLGSSDLLLGGGLDCSINAADGLIKFPVGTVLMITGILQIVLRLKTNTKVVFKKQV